MAARGMDTLPPHVAARLRRAHAQSRGAAKRLRAEVGWVGAALGVSVAGVALLSLLLGKSYYTNG